MCYQIENKSSDIAFVESDIGVVTHAAALIESALCDKTNCGCELNWD